MGRPASSGSNVLQYGRAISHVRIPLPYTAALQTANAAAAVAGAIPAVTSAVTVETKTETRLATERKPSFRCAETGARGASWANE